MNTLRMGPFAWGLFCTMTFLTNLHAADWPSYKADASRSSVTRDELKYQLVPVWVFEPSHSPAPAWPEPSKEPNRQSYDRAPQPVIARGIVYFASSSEDTVWAVDAVSGRVRWMFSTPTPEFL